MSVKNNNAQYMYIYVYMLFVHSSFTFTNIPRDIGPIFLSKFLIIVGTHLIRFCVICIFIVVFMCYLSGTPVRF